MFARKQNVVSLLICAAICGCIKSDEQLYAPQPKPATPLSGLRLNGEETPYFWRQNVNGEEHAAYRDGRFGMFLLHDSHLQSVRVYNTRDAEKRYLVYEAIYDEIGLRIKQSSYFRKNGSRETGIQRSNDGNELTSFYGADDKLIKTVFIEANGAQTSKTYADDGTTVASTDYVPAEPSEQVLTRHADGSCRIKLQLKGVRIASWQYFNKEGKLDHVASFEADGAIKFVCYKPEDGSLLRIQRWEVTGEDWNRAYYALASSEIFGEKNKANPQHKALFYRNGRAKQHFRYDEKGGVEAIRNFDITQQELCKEEFDERGESKGVFNYPVVRRGFIPNGLRGDPGAEDEKNPAYNFSDSIPFAEPRDTLSMNPLFILPKTN